MNPVEFSQDEINLRFDMATDSSPRVIYPTFVIILVVVSLLIPPLLLLSMPLLILRSAVLFYWEYRKNK